MLYISCCLLVLPPGGSQGWARGAHGDSRQRDMPGSGAQLQSQVSYVAAGRRHLSSMASCQTVSSVWWTAASEVHSPPAMSRCDLRNGLMIYEQWQLRLFPTPHSNMLSQWLEQTHDCVLHLRSLHGL